jgi:hypothetical protein
VKTVKNTRTVNGNHHFSTLDFIKPISDSNIFLFFWREVSKTVYRLSVRYGEGAGAETLHVLRHVRLTSSTSSWKWHRMHFDRPLMVTENKGMCVTHSLMGLSPSWEATILQLLKNFPAFSGTRRFITVSTRAIHWSLSWARSIQSIPSYLSKIHLNIRILFYSWQWRGIFLYSTAFRPALGLNQPLIQWVLWALSPGREVDHSRNQEWYNYTLTPLYVFMARCLINLI